MAAGETLVKLSDYPFVYSIGFVLVNVFGYDLTDVKSFPILASFGIVGTLLVIIDPVGWAIRKYFMRIARLDYNKLRQKNEVVNSWNYLESSFYTNAINIEKDKLVGVVYFIVSLLVFTSAITQIKSFAEKFVIVSDIFSCDLKCVQEYGWTVLAIFGLILVLKIIYDSIKISNKADIVATYLSSINSPTVHKESVNNIGRYIELGDWKTAEYWKNQIFEEIKSQAGLQEQRTKIQIDILEKKLEVYGTLHTMIEVAGRWSSLHGVPLDSKTPHYLFMAPEEESKFNAIFEKSNYLLSKQMFELFLEYEKTKTYKPGVFPGTSSSRSYVVCNLSNMEKQVKEEYEKLRNDYNKITGLNIV